MGNEDTAVEIEGLETGLLTAINDVNSEDNDNETSILYTASFGVTEDNFVTYETAKWVLYSLVLLLAWGIGVFMLLYLPVRRFVLRRDFRSRKLYFTPTSIVYKVTKPVLFPCLGVLVKEKHVLLHSVADIIIEQGYLQSLFGVYSVRIENDGVRRPPSDDLQIQGIDDPNAFRKAVLTHLANVKKMDAFSRQFSIMQHTPTFRADQTALMSPSKSKSTMHDAVPPDELTLLQKLDEVGSSIKRIQSMIEEQKSQTSQCVD